MNNCDVCTDGFVPFLPASSQKQNAEVTKDDLHFAVCLCALGDVWRQRDNCGRKVAPLWAVWCAKHGVDYKRVCMVEDVYSAAELQAAGLTRQPASLSREAALMARARGRQ